MKVLTEADLRTRCRKTDLQEIHVQSGTFITPTARDYIKEKGLALIMDGEGYSAEKPEHMTHLRKDLLVSKNHPRIACRGKLDSLQAKILEVQVIAEKNAESELTEDLQQLLDFVRRILSCEVKETPLDFPLLLGLDDAQLREMSHHPKEYFGIGHILPGYTMGEVAVALNSVRTAVRETELAAIKAFSSEGGVERNDIIKALNRLSSAAYLLICRKLSGWYEKDRTIPLEVSARHVHLNLQHMEALFGKGYELRPKRELSQPGQYLCEERVKIMTEKGEIADVAILGPLRKQTQVEISLTDARRLGLHPPIRQSGQLEDSEDIYIVSLDNMVKAEQSVIVPKNHIHMTQEDADCFGVQDSQLVKVRVRSTRPLTFEDVIVRVDDSFRLSMHIDFDEGNACNWLSGITGELMK